jgi:hypothetical protein
MVRQPSVLQVEAALEHDEHGDGESSGADEDSACMDDKDGEHSLSIL